MRPVHHKQAFLYLLAFLYALAAVNIIRPASGEAKAGLVFPVPFEGSEVHVPNIAAFAKWTLMLGRMDTENKDRKPWRLNREKLEKTSLSSKAVSINSLINKYDYIADVVNWGKSDHWETPNEFFKRGGDCEDFAIAKYAWLRSLGVPEELMRIAVVHDRIRDAPHAVLILYIDNKAMVLDSQISEIRDSQLITRYRMIYSINRLGWWLPRPERSAHMIGNDKHAIMDHDLLAQYSKDNIVGYDGMNAVEPASK